jgi:hypothetical protein
LRIAGTDIGVNEVQNSLEAIVGGSGDFKKLLNLLSGNIINVREDL